jgi:hypothetical protein
MLATADRNPPGLFRSTWYVGDSSCRSSAERIANILEFGCSSKAWAIKLLAIASCTVWLKINRSNRLTDIASAASRELTVVICQSRRSSARVCKRTGSSPTIKIRAFTLDPLSLCAVADPKDDQNYNQWTPVPPKALQTVNGLFDVTGGSQLPTTYFHSQSGSLVLNS